MQNSALLERLLEARRTHTLIDDLPPSARPATLDVAYATADALADALGVKTVGWKIGAAAKRGQRALGLQEPFAGRVFQGTVFATPASLSVGSDLLTIGAEFVLRVARDLERAERFDALSIREVIEAAYPALELNHPNFREPMKIGGLSLIADNGVGIGLVLGDAISNWRTAELNAHPVSLERVGDAAHRGCGRDIGFDAFAAVAWLANDRAKRNDPLRQGQFISSGDLVGAIEAGAPNRILADFGPFGFIQLDLQ